MVQLRTFCVLCAHMKQRKLLVVLKDMLLGFFFFKGVKILQTYTASNCAIPSGRQRQYFPPNHR